MLNKTQTQRNENKLSNKKGRNIIHKEEIKKEEKTGREQGKLRNRRRNLIRQSVEATGKRN